MRITSTTIPGVNLVEPEVAADERGLFARTYCAEEFAEAGLEPAVSQCAVSFNTTAGTLRGLHVQRGAHAEAKLIRCSRGRVWDVAVDLRAGSPTYGLWEAFELVPDGYRSVYHAPGIAHGFITLEDGSELTYQLSVPYTPAAAAGVRWDDPELAIAWPRDPTVISGRDRGLPWLADLAPDLEVRSR